MFLLILEILHITFFTQRVYAKSRAQRAQRARVPGVLACLLARVPPCQRAHRIPVPLACPLRASCVPFACLFQGTCVPMVCLFLGHARVLGVPFLGHARAHSVPFSRDTRVPMACLFFQNLGLLDFAIYCEINVTKLYFIVKFLRILGQKFSFILLYFIVTKLWKRQKFREFGAIQTLQTTYFCEEIQRVLTLDSYKLIPAQSGHLKGKCNCPLY